MENGSGGSADYELYKGGKHERFDAWSDNSRPEPQDFIEWAQRWIRAISNNVTP